MIKITIEIDDKEKQTIIVEPRIDQQYSKSVKKSRNYLSPIKLDTKATLNPIPKKYKVKGITICARCGKEFQPSSSAQKYCSEKCGLKHKSEKEKIKALQKKEITPKVNLKAKICRTCKKEFTHYTSNGQLYCCDECKNGGIIVDIPESADIAAVSLSDIDKPIKPEFPENRIEDNSNIITKLRDKIFPKGKQNIVNQPGEMNDFNYPSEEQIEKSKDHPYNLDR